MELKANQLRGGKEGEAEKSRPRLRMAPLVAGIAGLAALTAFSSLAKAEDQAKPVAVDTSTCDSKAPRGHSDEVIMILASYTKTVKASTTLSPAWSPEKSKLVLGEDTIACVEQVGENAVKMVVFFMDSVTTVELPYGETRGLFGGTEPRFRAEKGKNPGEAVITVERAEAAQFFQYEMPRPKTLERQIRKDLGIKKGDSLSLCYERDGTP